MLKFDHTLLRMLKIMKSVKSFLPKNAIEKHNQHPYKYVRATLKRIIIRFAIVFQFVPRVVHTFQVIHLRINILQAPIIPTTIVLQLLVYGV